MGMGSREGSMRGPMSKKGTISPCQNGEKVIGYRKIYSELMGVTNLSTRDRGGREDGGFQPPELHDF